MAEEHRPFDIPVLETPRTLMRPHALADFDDVAEMWADPAVVRHISGKPSTRQDSWARLLRYIGHWSALHFGYWVLEDKQSGQFLGEVGFADFKRDIIPSLSGLPEMGWVLRSSAHGRGLATEAVMAALAWGNGNLASNRTVCLVSPENAASIRVAQKCGFRKWEQTTYMEETVILLERPLSR